MLLDRETIYGIVEDGKFTRSEAVVLQDNQPLTKEQRQWWSEATLLKKANADKRRERKRNIDALATGGGEDAGPMSGAERVRKHNILKAAIDDVLDDAMTRINWRRRRKCEASLLEFVKTYGIDEGAFLEDRPAPLMEQILDEMQIAIDDSSVPYHIRVARGHGKTSYAKLGCAWAAATGKRHFIIAVGSNTANANNIVSDLFTFFQESPKFAHDFPEIALPLASLNGVHQRAHSQTYRGKPTKITMGVGGLTLPTIEGAASSGCIIQSVGFATSARGKVKGKRRPDLLILDDLQSDDMAGNAERVVAAAEHIKKTFLGLAGHKKKIAAVMTSTPIEPDDLSEVFARDPSWKTTTHKMVLSWPKAWKTEDEAKDLWGQYRDILRREITKGNKKPHVVANKFYREHFDAMNDGAVVLNPRNFDSSTELSGIQHAMNILIRDGQDVFDSEYQMCPRRHAFAFDISANLIVRRVRRGVAKGTLIDNAVFTAVATDINPSYALTTAWASFDVQRSCLVGGYGITRMHVDDSANDTEFHQQVFDALARTAEQIRAYGVKFNAWGIDAGGKQFQPVTRFASMCEAQYGVKAVAMTGRAGRNWNPNVRSKIRAAINSTVICRDERTGFKWMAWNADEYKESAQRAWFAEPGSPGGCSLFDGDANHTDFATQIANERLVDKKPLPGGLGFAYAWKTKEPHDYGDCMAMLYALAGADGLNGDGCRTVQKHKRRVYGE